MKITTLGCGNAFSRRSFNQSFLVEEGKSVMMIDCGQKAIDALIHAGRKVSEITDVYVSHKHGDHIGALEELAFLRYDWKNRPRNSKTAETPYAPRLIANTQLMKELWEMSLRGGLESMEGFVANLDTFYKTTPIDDNETFKWEGWSCKLIQQVHIMTGSTIACTFGLMMSKTGHKTIYFTTDSQHVSPRQMEVFYQEADIIFQDCECTPWMSGVHANYAQLAGYPEANSVRLPAEIKKKMWLSHYQDFVLDNKDALGNDCNWFDKAQNDGFAGFLVAGQKFEI
jgi:ribonuclease BN (tRNA processing enzyme)